MARAWINDRWLTDATATLEDGTTVRVPPPADAKRSLSMHMDDPQNARVPEQYKTAVFGRGARWTVFWWADGRRHRRNFADYGKADEFRASLEDDIRSARYVNPQDGRRTFGETASLWAEGLHGRVRGSTEGRYLRELRIWVLPRWKTVPLERIRPALIQQWVSQLASGTAPRDGRIGEARPLAAKSIRSIVMVVFKGVLDLAVSNRWITTNPVNGVKVPKAVERRRVYLTPVEIKCIADVMDRDDATAVYLLAYTGLRIGELLALRCGDVDLDGMLLSVTRTQTVDADFHVTEGAPKNGRTRTVPIPPSLRRRVMDLLDGHGDGDYLIRAPRGGMQTTRNWRNRVWAPALRASGMDEVDGLTIHSLRHTYASLAVKAGADVKTLQSVMGHTTASETLDVYADLWPDRTGQIATAIDGEILL